MSLPQCTLPPNTASPPCEALTENIYNLDVGYTYRVTVPPIVIYDDVSGTHIMQFVSWADGPTTNIRDIINFNADLIITANYVELTKTTVSGTVTDVTDGLPIAGANVTFTINAVNYTPVLTDANGYYQIEVAIANGYTMTVSKTDYQTYVSLPFDVPTSGITNLNVALQSTPPTPYHTRLWLFAHSLTRASARWNFPLIEVYDQARQRAYIT